MDPIANTDRLVLLLRAKLEERSKARAGAKAGAAAAAATGVRALAGIEGVEEKPLRRAVLASLIADQLGPELINDARFQEVVRQVSEAIDDDPATAALLSRVIAELRSGA